MDTKALRQKILDLAIRGKLVPQDPNDEPASVLLERIRAEKQQMVKEGKLKPKDIKNDTIIFVGEDNLHYEKFQDGSVKCIEDEIPFEVPEGWSWARLNQIFNFIDYRGSTPTKISSGVPLITAKNVKSGYIDYTVDDYISEDEYADRQQRGISCYGDILFTTEAPLGNAAIADLDKFSAGQRLITFQHYGNQKLNNTNFLYFLLSDFFQNQLNANKTGSTVAGIKAAILKGLFLPVPPIEEQQRIAASCKNMFNMIEIVKNEQEDISKLISITKSKILDLAIRGKLVPQDPNDEPASVLLDRIQSEKEELIKAGKIKRDKKESVIFKGEDNSYYEKIGDKIRCIDAEIPFDLPELWTFARLKHIGGIVGGGTPKTNIGKYWDGNIPWLTPADLSGYDSMYISTGSRTITDFGLKSSSAQMLPANSILYSSRAPIGYTAIATNPVCTNQGFKSVVPYDFSISPYLYYSLKARTDNIIQRATGTTFKEISGSEMAETIIPIPPLNEQSKIVEKVTQLQEVISLIEKSLN
ncbi:restriction endonuclease subunit S [Clostridium sp. AF36-4]|uniref:restriction endonuclease subunit S n=1 Tax=Clostridium sp. AF36-4 TaxID=2293015 RepID=UPI000E3F2F12|nr:restriction endonuclease subunit S [Clostridium sp. AF36-4]RGF54185.1 restriction endonuclease subunit S [Clostridium sp. AF36-4]